MLEIIYLPVCVRHYLCVYVRNYVCVCIRQYLFMLVGYLSIYVFIIITGNKVFKVTFLYRMDSDDSYDGSEENLKDEEVQWLLLCGLVVKGLLLTHKMSKTHIPCHSSSRTGSI